MLKSWKDRLPTERSKPKSYILETLIHQTIGVPTSQTMVSATSKFNLSTIRYFFDIGHGDLSHDERALELFIARILSHPEFAGKIRAMVKPAYAELIRRVSGSKGIVLERASIEGFLRSAVLASLSQEASVIVWVQNWTKEAFDPPPDYELDWSSHFDRASRRVPPPDVWNTDLVPQLDALRKQIMAAGAVRTIRLRGKCALSTGVALDATFPAVGGSLPTVSLRAVQSLVDPTEQIGRTFEIPQPPAKEPWRSDARARLKAPRVILPCQPYLAGRPPSKPEWKDFRTSAPRAWRAQASGRTG